MVSAATIFPQKPFTFMSFSLISKPWRNVNIIDVLLVNQDLFTANDLSNVVPGNILVVNQNFTG